MARKVRDARLEKREGRLQLKPQKQPYWRSIKPGAFIGYYRGKHGGNWIGRCQAAGVYSYKYRTIGNADDYADANGIDVFNYGQALDAVLAFSTELVKEERGIKAGATVAHACKLYLSWFELHRKSTAQTRTTINAFILPTFEHTRLNDLTTAQIRRWFEKIALAPKRLRSSKLKQKEKSVERSDPEAMRRRKASANRVLTVLKALLNHAWREGLCGTNEAWSRVQAFRGVDTPRIQYLNTEQSRDLINAANASFRQLVQAGLLTGCRYGELTSLRSRDFNPKGQTIVIVESKTGKPRRVPLNVEGLTLFIESTRGKKPEDPIFVRADGKQWGPSHQHRPMQDAVKAAKLPRDVTFYTLRHSYAASLAMNGVSMRALSELLGNSAKICERHYAHISENHLADAVRNFLPTFAESSAKVIPIERARMHNVASAKGA